MASRRREKTWRDRQRALILVVFACVLSVCIGLQFQSDCTAAPLEKYAPSFDDHIVQPPYLEHDPTQDHLPSDTKLQLKTLVDAALRFHPSLRRSWAQINASAASVGKALSSYYPDVSTRVFANYNDEGKYRDYEMWEENTKMGVSLGITYLLLDTGTRKNTERAEKKQLDAANSAYNQAVLDLVFAVQQQYYAYVRSQQMLAARQASLRTAKSNRERAKDFFAAGLNSESAVLQAQAHVSQVKYQLATSKSEVRQNWKKLASICGIPVSPRREVQAPAQLNRQLVSQNAAALLKKAQAENPGLQALQSEIRSGERSVAAAQGAFGPELSFVGSATGQKVHSVARDQARVEDDEYQAMVGLQLTYDLFTGFSDTYAKREAQARLKVAKERYAARQLALKQRVEEGLSAYRAAVDKLNASQQFVQDAQKSHAIAVDLVKAGEGRMLEVTRALEQLADAKSERVAARMEMYTAAASLAHSCGAFEQLGAARAHWEPMQ